MARKKTLEIKLARLLKRNLSARQARNQKAGAMKDRRTGRGGARNTMREDLSGC